MPQIDRIGPFSGDLQERVAENQRIRPVGRDHEAGAGDRKQPPIIGPRHELIIDGDGHEYEYKTNGNEDI